MVLVCKSHGIMAKPNSSTITICGKLKWRKLVRSNLFVLAIRGEFEQAPVEFISAKNGNGVGVRLEKTEDRFRSFSLFLSSRCRLLDPLE